jgi:hypothetical protein
MKTHNCRGHPSVSQSDRATEDEPPGNRVGGGRIELPCQAQPV